MDFFSDATAVCCQVILWMFQRR